MHGPPACKRGVTRPAGARRAEDACAGEAPAPWGTAPRGRLAERLRRLSGVPLSTRRGGGGGGGGGARARGADGQAPIAHAATLPPRMLREMAAGLRGMRVSEDGRAPACRACWCWHAVAASQLASEFNTRTPDTFRCGTSVWAQSCSGKRHAGACQAHAKARSVDQAAAGSPGMCQVWVGDPARAPLGAGRPASTRGTGAGTPRPPAAGSCSRSRSHRAARRRSCTARQPMRGPTRRRRPWRPALRPSARRWGAAS